MNQYNRSSTLMNAYSRIAHTRFRSTVIREKSGVYNALKFFFSRQETGEKMA
ncbi:hypothetical protein LLE49_04065 [Alicyclobacillus tolerans]|uniref:hypothetical protein n=1 Tax=Alicyclobacillus tolerans TaxID=90970 RepID=UPI001F1B81B6|nr:hypothetical protein [Alicyclobacillus tolerans]MCF8563912.1 hypothetical protein [Alicyclobacillus tolerans]